LNWKSKKDVKDEVTRRFDATVSSLIDVRLQEIDKLISENKRRFDSDKEQINKILVELSSRAPAHAGVPPQSRQIEEKSQSKRLLWVDDHPENNDYPRQIFEQLGIQVVLSRSTEEALQRLAERKFDLVISDMGRDSNPKAGLDLLEQMRDKRIDTPTIIYASSRAVRLYGGQARELGAREVITGVTEVLASVSHILFEADN
jgi:CheY-like chemotaxis protein